MLKIFTGIERGRGTIEIDGRRISLPAKSYEYIMRLAFCLDRTMSHEELEPAEPNNAIRYIYNLRKQLGKHGNIIERVRNVGYRLNYDGMIRVAVRELYDTLEKLSDEIEGILVKAREAKIKGAINWGDLHVRDVSFCQSLDGGTYYLVLIEEAAPDNHELHEYIRQNITVLQASDIVEIETEW